MSHSDAVIVVGGGIAGIACASRLARAGVSVTLLETRKKLGGRATSFNDTRTGLTIDNCQHVAMGCCTNYLRFCDELGVRDKITWLRETHWIEPGGRLTTMRPGPLPAPFHLTGAFLRAAFLSVPEKVAIARAMNAILRTDRFRERTRTFAEWLAERGQPESVIEKFWTPVTVSACNLTVERVSASSALHVFQEGFLAHRDAALVGVASVPLVELYDPAEELIADSGGEVRLGTGVEEVGERYVVTTGGERLEGQRVVCALPCERAMKVVTDDLQAGDARFAAMKRIEHSPILGVHLVFDRSVLPVHSAVLVGRPTQWLFRKQGDPLGSHIHAVISAADEWVALDEAEIGRRVLEDIHACLPGSVFARVLSVRAVKEKRATFAPTPLVELERPPLLGADGAGGLVLAGDYVQSGWPATMEGAARTGFMAAAAVLGDDPRDALVPPLRAGAVARRVAQHCTTPARFEVGVN